MLNTNSAIEKIRKSISQTHTTYNLLIYSGNCKDIFAWHLKFFHSPLKMLMRYCVERERDQSWGFRNIEKTEEIVVQTKVNRKEREVTKNIRDSKRFRGHTYNSWIVVFCSPNRVLLFCVSYLCCPIHFVG